jgi:hypothetical protein
MDRRSAGHAGLGSGTPKCNYRHVFAGRDSFGRRDLGSAAATAGVVPTFLGAGLLAIVTLAIVHFTVQKRLSIDFAADLNLEPAAVTIFPRFGPDAIVAGGGESGLDRHRICN